MRNYFASGIAIVLIAAAAWSFVSYQRTPPAVLVLPHSDMVLSVAFSPDGYRLVTAAGNDAHLWDAETGQRLAVLGPHDGWVTGAEFSPDGRRVVTASADKTARLWEVEDGTSPRPWFLRREDAKLLVTFIGHEKEVWSATFTPDGERVFTRSADGTVRGWSADTGKEYFNAPAVSVSHDSDGGRVVVAARNCQGAYLYRDIAGKRGLLRLATHDEGCMGAATLSPDGRRVAVGLSDEAVELWDADTGKSVAILEGHKSFLLGTAFSPDSRRFATISFDKTARLWDGRTGQPLATLTGHERSVGSVAFSPDNRRVATTSFDRTARLWDGDAGQPVATLTGHTHDVRRAAFSPDGRVLATASSDRTARLWRLAP